MTSTARVRCFCQDQRAGSYTATTEGTAQYYEEHWFPEEINEAALSPQEKGRLQERRTAQESEREKTGLLTDPQRVPLLHGRSGLYLPPVALSCLRLSVRQGTHHEVVSHAINKGINLFETSTLYPESQHILGEALGDRSRDQFIVLTKIGFQSDLRPQGLRITGHNMDVEFLRHELTQSLGRMGLQSTDFLLIQQPEAAFSESVNAERIYEQLEKVFAWAEEEVANGRVLHYGVSSRAITASPDHPHFLSLECIVEAATRAKKGEDHHFSAVSVPFNLFEDKLLTMKNCAQGTQTVSEWAREKDIAVFTYRPLRDQTDIRFVEYPDHQDKDILRLMKDSFSEVLGMEKAYRETVMSNPAFPKYEEIAIAEILLESQSSVSSIALWKDTVDQAIYPYRDFILRRLKDSKDDAGQWVTAYQIATDELLERITWNLEMQAHHAVSDLCSTIDDVLPALRPLPLETKALRVAHSAGATSVSVGMRQLHQVDENIKTLHYPLLPQDELKNLFSRLSPIRERMMTQALRLDDKEGDGEKKSNSAN